MRTLRKALCPTLAQFADKKFYVVHRLRYAPSPYRFPHAFGGSFQLKIMSNWAFSSEVRSQAIQCLREQVARSPVAYLPIDVSIGGMYGTVYLVAATDRLAAAVDSFYEWVESDFASIEETDFPDAFIAEHRVTYPDRYTTDTWWSYTDAVLWTMNVRNAQVLVETIESLVNE